MKNQWKADETDRKRIALIISLLVHLFLLYGLWHLDKGQPTQDNEIQQIEQNTELVRDQFLKS